MKKETAIKIIVGCAKDYHTYLENKNLLFLFGAPQQPQFFEAAFLPRNFLHLTGVEVVGTRFSGSSDFYEKALKGALSPDDFSLAKNGITEMKLLVLPQLMKIYRSAKMVSDYSFTKSTLYTEKLAGNVTACLGFLRNDKYYVPNTALKEDIRDISAKPQYRILAVLRKPIGQPVYEEVCCIVKGLTMRDISLPKELQGQVVLPATGEKTNVSAEPTRQSMKERITAAQAEADLRNSSSEADLQQQPDKRRNLQTDHEK